MWKVCFRKHPSSLGNKQLLYKHSQMKFCKGKGESELRWKLWSQREDSISLPLTHFQDSVFFAHSNWYLKQNSETTHGMMFVIRLELCKIKFSLDFIWLFFLELNPNRCCLFFSFSFTLLYKISCRTFLYTDLKKESVKKTLRMFLSLHTLCPSVLRSPSFIFLKH